MARCRPKPKLLSPYFSASKSFAQLADNWDGSEGLSVYSLSGRDTPRVICSQTLPSRELVCPEKAKRCALACVGLAAVPAPLVAPVRTRWFMSHPNEGLVWSYSILSIACFPGLWGSQRLTFPSELGLGICPSLLLTHRLALSDSGLISFNLIPWTGQFAQSANKPAYLLVWIDHLLLIGLVITWHSSVLT